MTDTGKVSELVARLRGEAKSERDSDIGLPYCNDPDLLDSCADTIEKLEAQLVHITAVELDTAKRLWESEDERAALAAKLAECEKDAERIIYFFQMAQTPPDDIDTWRAEQDAEIAAIAARGDENYDCPIHGPQDGPDCPRC